MEFIAEQKYIRLSPKKIRPILAEVKKLSVEQALQVLPFVAKRGAYFVEKVIKSAVANARQKGVEISNLKIKEIVANEGPVLKRGRPVSRGQWHPIKKRMSHIRVILSSAEEEKTAKETKPKLQDKEKEPAREKKTVVKKESNKVASKKSLSKKVIRKRKEDKA
ncbi:MAG: 50S ribosomal protein L22 [Patescibacteria group bacterium]|nr:MAG: 50S ribosomal protein L22 [Patescibacteria group bacterium]